MATQVKAETPTMSEVLRAQADVLEVQANLLRAQANKIEQAEDEPSADGDTAVTPKEAARQLGISVVTVRQLIRKRRIRAERSGTKLYRIALSELAAYRRRNTNSIRRAQEGK